MLHKISALECFRTTHRDAATFSHDWEYLTDLAEVVTIPLHIGIFSKSHNNRSTRVWLPRFILRSISGRPADAF